MTAQKLNPDEPPTLLEQEEREVKELTAEIKKLSPQAAREVMGALNKQVSGFADFLREQGVVGIGIGLVLGIQVKAVVDTIMASFVNPLTELLLPGQEELSQQTFTFHFDGSSVTIGWGAIVYSLFTFVMVAVIIYAGYKLLKLDKLAKKKD